ncbi:hypothetical protein DFH09DRAFT_1357934 [Mycena vulgaris]|nr:hypothetical protein DFH09DRAFT_1357934 [Mycena vulgaris]
MILERARSWPHWDAEGKQAQRTSPARVRERKFTATCVPSSVATLVAEELVPALYSLGFITRTDAQFMNIFSERGKAQTHKPRFVMLYSHVMGLGEARSRLATGYLAHPYTAVQLREHEQTIWGMVRSYFALQERDRPRFHLDKPWQRVVIHRVPVTTTSTSRSLVEELRWSNESIGALADVMGVRDLCSIEGLQKRREGLRQGVPQETSLMLMLLNVDVARRFLREGTYYEMHCAEIASPSTPSASSPPRRHRRHQRRVSHVQNVIVLDAPRTRPRARLPPPAPEPAIATPELCFRSSSCASGNVDIRKAVAAKVGTLSCSVGVEAGCGVGGASTALRLGVASRGHCVEASLRLPVAASLARCVVAAPAHRPPIAGVYASGRDGESSLRCRAVCTARRRCVCAPLRRRGLGVATLLCLGVTVAGCPSSTATASLLPRHCRLPILTMRSTDPREGSPIFREYVGDIHAHPRPADPNSLAGVWLFLVLVAWILYPDCVVVSLRRLLHPARLPLYLVHPLPLLLPSRSLLRSFAPPPLSSLPCGSPPPAPTTPGLPSPSVVPCILYPIHAPIRPMPAPCHPFPSAASIFLAPPLSSPTCATPVLARRPLAHLPTPTRFSPRLHPLPPIPYTPPSAHPSPSSFHFRARKTFCLPIVLTSSPSYPSLIPPRSPAPSSCSICIISTPRPASPFRPAAFLCALTTLPFPILHLPSLSRPSIILAPSFLHAPSVILSSHHFPRLLPFPSPRSPFRQRSPSLVCFLPPYVLTHPLHYLPRRRSDTPRTTSPLLLPPFPPHRPGFSYSLHPISRFHLPPIDTPSSCGYPNESESEEGGLQTSEEGYTHAPPRRLDAATPCRPPPPPGADASTAQRCLHHGRDATPQRGSDAAETSRLDASTPSLKPSHRCIDTPMQTQLSDAATPHSHAPTAAGEDEHRRGAAAHPAAKERSHKDRRTITHLLISFLFLISHFPQRHAHSQSTAQRRASRGDDAALGLEEVLEVEKVVDRGRGARGGAAETHGEKCIIPTPILAVMPATAAWLYSGSFDHEQLRVLRPGPSMRREGEGGMEDKVDEADLLAHNTTY